MTMNILESAASLSDHLLLVGLERLAGDERRTTVELLAHLAVLDTRAILYAAEGYGTLFAYCTQALRLSEDAACNRIAVARTCRRFPTILDLLASGAMTLSSVRMLAPHLTPENQELILDRARGGTVRQIEELVAEIAPRADARSSVRKEPTPHPTGPAGPAPARRPVIEVTAPTRYRVQFTVGQETHDTLRRLQTLLRREIPNGDPGEIVGRALDLLLDKVEKTKMAAAAPPRSRPQPRPRNSIRRETDNDIRTPIRDSRHIPNDVRRDVWRRDGGQCAFVANSGRRCSETTFLELHHVHAYAKGGPATFASIALRCRRHNQYEADLLFGPNPARTRGGISPQP